MKNITLLISIALLTGTCQSPEILQKMDLSGTWQFALDPRDLGITESWYNLELSGSLQLPGSLTSNGIGDEITASTPWTGQIVDSTFYKNQEYSKFREPGNFKVPFWLQPVKYYKGAAWYQKEVNIPETWKERSVVLFLERCHWETRLWVDGKESGMQHSLGTPHLFDLTGRLTPGKHRLTLCVDNRVKDIDPGINSHSISDHTQGNWNGMTGKMYLEARPLVNIQNVQVYPDFQNNTISVEVKVRNQSDKKADVRLNLSVAGTTLKGSKDYELKLGETLLVLNMDLHDGIKRWSEFHPEVYSLEAVLNDRVSGTSDVRSTTFGIREFKAVGNKLTVNGQPVFLRGTLECAIFPKTGYPATDVGEWLRIFSVCRAHGLNHMRFHSWCPPEAAFDAADQSGFYLQVECSSWANQSTTLGDGKPIDQYVYEESLRMVEHYGNHPSFCMMAYGNEPGGANQVAYLTDFVTYWKEKDNRRIYTAGAGWPALSTSDYISDPEPRIQRWAEGLGSIINSKAPATDYDWSEITAKYPQPVVSHEIGQWCVYPNFREIRKYTGVMRARNFELFRETLGNNGMLQLADSFLMASGKLQVLCYKADIEAALRTRDFGGFQLLDLHDFPGQGTALVGVLDPFWEEKGYVTPQEYSQFCNSTVPLARMSKCIYTNDEALELKAEVAHFGDGPLTDCIPEWKISGTNGRILQSGKFAQTDIPVGNAFSIGTVSFPLKSVHAPEKLTLEINVNGWINHWDFWVYPHRNPVSGGESIRVVQQLDAQTKQFLKNGGSVLLNLKKGTLAKELGGDILTGFSSIFWNTAWTGRQAPHTLGILCNPKHPALALFPTEFHSNYQWWDAMSHSAAIRYSKISPDITPIVRVIDDWATNRPLALLFEARVGKGKIMVSGIDLTSDLDKRPEAVQLLYSLKTYMTGNTFNPTVVIREDQVEQLTQK